MATCCVTWCRCRCGLLSACDATTCLILAGFKCGSGEAGNILHIPARTGWADAEQDFRFQIRCLEMRSPLHFPTQSEAFFEFMLSHKHASLHCDLVARQA